MKLCEVYTSVQGEGPNTGKPIQFIRFGGCNLRCSGWGVGTLPDGTEVGGCDTVFAVYPEWRDTWESQTLEEVFDEVQITPRHVCLTGGEPLIQPTKQIHELVDRLFDHSYKIDLFTNGTQWLERHLWVQDPTVTVVMDWKLLGSGEYGSFDIRNLDYLSSKDAIKFVIKGRLDFEDALSLISMNEPRMVGVGSPQIYFGPVWDHLDPNILAEWVTDQAPYARLNIQTHKYIWPADERRR